MPQEQFFVGGMSFGAVISQYKIKAEHMVAERLQNIGGLPKQIPVSDSA